MSKVIERSDDMKNWEVFGACSDEDFEEAWKDLQEWIRTQQPYGFFRAVDDPRSLEELTKVFDLMSKDRSAIGIVVRKPDGQTG